MSNFASEIKKASIAVLIQNLRINFLKFKKMKRNRNPTNKSVMKRYATLDSSIGSRLLLDRFSIALRSVLVRSSIGSRSSFVHPSFILRSGFVRDSKNNKRINEEATEMYLRHNGGTTKDERSQNDAKTKPKQKESFCLSKRFVLLTKRTPFTVQNDSF